MALWTPANLTTGPRAWYRMDLLSAANDAVPANIPDSSGNGRTGTVYSEPHVVASGLNGMKTLRSTNTTRLGGFSLPSDVMGSPSAGCAFILFKNQEALPGHHSPLQDFGSHGAGEHWPFSDGNVYDGFGSTARKTIASAGLNNTNFNLVHIRSAASDYQFWVNGTSVFTTSTNTVGWGSAPVAMTKLGGVFGGEVAEIILLNYIPTTEEREQIEGYVLWRWGRQAALPGGHTYASAAPTTGAAAYRITGIGWMRRGVVPAGGSSLTLPTITGNPTLSGTVQVGNTITAVAAPTGGNPAPSTTWQWNLDGSPIAGATSTTYTPLVGQVGGSLTVTQTATNSQGSVSATSAGTTIAAASSGAGEIEAVTISNGGTGTLDAGTTVFGMLFEEGEFPAGTKLEASIGGTTYAVQSDVRTTHGDGSAYHAILAVDRPAGLTAGSSITATISSVSGSQAAPVDLRAAMVAAPVSVRMTVTAPSALAQGEITFDASAAIIAAIDAGTIDYRLRGPKLTRGRVQWNPHGINSAMRVVVDVTAWADGAITVDANYCNDVINEWAVHHGPMTFSARVLIGGAERGSFASLYMLLGAHWLIKATTANCPHGTIMHQDRLNVVIPVQRWIETNLLGILDTETDPSRLMAYMDNQRVANASTWERPFYPNGLTPSMGQAGGRWELGPLPAPYTLFLRTGDFRMARWIRGLATTGNGIPWHWYDRTNGRYHDSTVNKEWWTNYYSDVDLVTPLDSPLRALPAYPRTIQRPDGIEPIGPDFAHHPDTATVPYLVTGEDWILDQMEALATRCITGIWSGHRGGNASSDLEVLVNGRGGHDVRDLYTGPRYTYEPYEHRAVVWCLRAIQNVMEYGRPGHTKTWATSVFNKNIAALKAGIPLWEQYQGSYKGWWDCQFNVRAANFQQAYGGLMLFIWARRGAGGQDLRDFINWHTEHWVIGRLEQTDFEWENMTGISFMGANPKTDGVPTDFPTNYAHLFNARYTSYAAARAGTVERNDLFNINTGAGMGGNYQLLDMAVIWSARNWYADPSRGNNPGFVTRLEAVYELFRTRVPALPHTAKISAEDELTFGYWKPKGWNPYRNVTDPIPGVPTAIVSTPLAAVPDEPPAGYLICNVAASAGAIRTIEIRNETVPGTLVAATDGITTTVRVAAPAAIDFQTRTSFSFEIRIRNDGVDGADTSAWLPLSFDITAGTPVVAAGVYSIKEHAPTASPPEVLRVGQVIGQVPITTPVALSGAPEITTQTPAGAVSLGTVSGSVPNLTVPLLVADPTDFDNEGTNPVLVTVRATNAKGTGVAVEQRINLINVVEPGDAAPLLLDSLSVPNTTVMACGGLMRLTRQYGGPLVKVYNDGGTGLDIGAGDEWVDWAEIAAHIGSARGTVEIYDQISGALITAPAPGRRPYISAANGAMLTAAGTSGGRPMMQWVASQAHQLRRAGYTVGGSQIAAVMHMQNASGSAYGRALSVVGSTDAGAEVMERFANLVYVQGGIGSRRWGNTAIVSGIPADGVPVTVSALFTSSVGQRSRVNGTTASSGWLGTFPTTLDLYLGGLGSASVDHTNMLMAGFCVLSATNDTDLATVEAGLETLIGY